MTLQDYVILDRDGVINYDSEAFIKSPQEWIPLPKSLEAIAVLNRSGFRVVIATNQSGIARGYFDIQMLNRIHDKMHRMVADHGGTIDTIYYCPHGPQDHCKCRKPKTGLLEQFASEHDVQFKNTPFIGDSPRDIQAGIAVGAQPFLVKTGKGTKTLKDHPNINVPVFNNLYEASQFIISRQ